MTTVPALSRRRFTKPNGGPPGTIGRTEHIEIDISGAWVVEIDWRTGPAQHTLKLKRDGDTLTGSHETPFGNGEGTGP